MNLLIDFLTTQGKYGAGEYLRRVVFSLFDYIQQHAIKDIKLFALYDSRKEISYEDMQEESLGKKYSITYCDLHKKNLLSIIDENHIDRFFIACGQRIGEYPEISDVRCDVICVTHDLLYEEWYHNHMYEYWQLLLPSRQMQKPPKWKWQIYFDKKSAANRLARYILRMHRDRTLEKPMVYMSNVSKMICANEKATYVMVSEYSKNTMVYNYHISPDRIKVLYSPERIATPTKPVENIQLKELIDSNQRFYLMVSCDREGKNPVKALKAFQRYVEMHPDVHFVMIGMNPYYGVCSGNVHAMDFLSDSDLKWAMQKCYALVYPSFFEGFGYPPLEAMKYGKPVICTNATSLPEILEDAPIYCSPLYESAIFAALTQLTDDNYEEYAERSLKQYAKIRNRQEHDLQELIKMILAPRN